MGASQSTSSAEEAAVLVHRLHSMRVQDRVRQHDVERDYVEIENEKGIPTSFSSDPSLSISAAEAWEKDLLADPKNRLAISALSNNDVRSIIHQDIAVRPDIDAFNVKIPFEGAPITNQRSSGRCWLFAATNVLRVPIMKKYNLKDFELSQSYLFFWDKLEKANWFLEQILDTSDMELDSRLVQELLKDPVTDGGQWDMAANLVHKYGLIPQSLYPDNFQAKSSSQMDAIVTAKLRQDALKLRSMKSDHKTTNSSLAATKARMIREIHCILTLTLGPPPKPSTKFTWEFYDANNKFHSVSRTPLDFAAELSHPSSFRTLGTNVSRMFSLVNDPRNPYMSLLTVDRLGNIVGGRPVTYVNVDMATIKAAAISMLKAGVPVFFGSDVGKYFDAAGILDTKLYDYKLAFNVSLDMSKAQRLQTRESAVTHAMVLSAVHLCPTTGHPVRWRVQNSWGSTAGHDGYFVMTDAWMDEFVYQIVTDAGYVSKEVSDVLDSKKDGKAGRVLELWDPIGALA